MEKFAILNMKEDGYVMGLVAESKFDAIHMGVEHAEKINYEKFVELNKDRDLTYEDVLAKMGLIIINIDERTSDSLLQFPYGGPIEILSVG